MHVWYVRKSPTMDDIMTGIIPCIHVQPRKLTTRKLPCVSQTSIQICTTEHTKTKLKCGSQHIIISLYMHTESLYTRMAAQKYVCTHVHVQYTVHTNTVCMYVLSLKPLKFLARNL